MQNFVVMRYYIPIFLLFLANILTACINNEENNETSSEARVQTFTFYEDTLNIGLTEATYKIEHSGDTGRIYCVDSLRFGTRLDSVVPYVTYMATPGSATFILPDTTIVSTGVDVMNFNQSPIYLHVLASDMENEQWYRIDIAAHQVNPDLYVWKKLADKIFPDEYGETKAFYFQQKIILFLNNGLSTQVYQSANGEHWSLLSKVNSLPTPCHVRDIIQHHDTLYYIANNRLYWSTDLLNWEKKDYTSSTFSLINMLVSYDNKPWCLLQDTATSQLMLGTITKDSIVVEKQIAGLKDGFLPNHFPINDFAALSFSGSSERPRAMIVGGRDIDGNIVNSRWNLEYAPTVGYRLKDFSISQPSFKSLTGVSIIHYNKRFIMFGGTDNDLGWRSNILYSDDEGMNWYAPDSTVNQLPNEYQPRQNQTVLTDTLNNIYIIGGQSHSQTFSDVYCGYINSAKWE